MTRSIERLAEFYADVFGARAPYERSASDRERGLGFIAVGDATVLHVFERPEGALGGVEEQSAGEPLGRGRIDHFSLEAADLAAFTQIRERLLSRGATDGTVTDFGPLVSVFFVDPDGFQGELSLTKPADWKAPFDTEPPSPLPHGLDLGSTST